jgi:hypothetical protein
VSANWAEQQPEILHAGTHPLPFVQVGMRVCAVMRYGSFGCLVQDVYEDSRGMTVARLQGVQTGRSMVVSCAEVRRCYALMADFDPNLPNERDA